MTNLTGLRRRSGRLDAFQRLDPVNALSICDTVGRVRQVSSHLEEVGHGERCPLARLSDLGYGAASAADTFSNKHTSTLTTPTDSPGGLYSHLFGPSQLS